MAEETSVLHESIDRYVGISRLELLIRTAGWRIENVAHGTSLQ
jgi:hypothetical protein